MNDMVENTKKGTILLVDDDKFLLDMYTMKFTNEGYTVHACLSVNDALKTLREGFVPDAILFDLVMPENDGFALLTMLSKEDLSKGAVRIALTNESDDAAKAKATEFGADRLLEKASMIPTEVVHIVGEEIARKRWI